VFGECQADESRPLPLVFWREPDLWAQVEPIDARFNKFLGEFTGYDDQIDVQPRNAVPSESGGESQGRSLGTAERVVPNMPYRLHHRRS
jgi:hypothetical protein